MPATFAHCLMTRKAINILRNTPGGHPYIQILGENGHFAVMGATSPDYPYLTNPVFSGLLKTVHSWADRMHYENTDKFIKEGVARLSSMDKSSEAFKSCLAWLLGYASHVVADSYVHPVINCIVGGPYIFTHAEHAKCEMIQDVFIFHDTTATDIVDANPRDDSTFGFLNILDECSEPGSPDQLNTAVKDMWTALLKFAHPQAEPYFDDIDPDTWHKNYRRRIGDDADASLIFRHACGLVGVSVYERLENIHEDDLKKYVNDIPLPSETRSNYTAVFDGAVDKIIETWGKMFADIQAANADNVKTYVEDWNLDTGVDENKIVLWAEGV